MATPVKNIEKKALLRVLYEEELPVTYFQNRVEYSLFLKKPAREEMVFQTDRPIGKLNIKDRIDLAFNYRGRAIAFNAEVLQAQDTEITCTIPDSLYKNLDRSYSRVSLPEQMRVQFTFLGDHYDLSFPKVIEYDDEDIGDFFQDKEIHDLSGLIEQMADWIKKYASDYRLVLFKDTKPSAVEELVISETGKILFLPTTRNGFPRNDPFPRKRIITENIFKRYLESTGIGLAFVDRACARFVQTKTDKGILSDVWVPILFQEYVIGYIHTWIDVEGKHLFDYPMINTLRQFAKVLAYSLKLNGYLEQEKLKNDAFEGKVIDISASGLLFAYPHLPLFSVLQPKSKLTVEIITSQRSITTEAIVVRCFKDKVFGYFGCQFDKINPEDMCYLFEFIYGKPFTELDAKFLTGQA